MSTVTEIALSDIPVMNLFALDRHATHGNHMTPHGGHEFLAAFHAPRFHHPHHSHHSPVPTLKG